MVRLLAYMATAGRHSLAEIQALLAERRHAMGRTALVELEPLDPSWLQRLARTLALQRLEPSDRRDALDLLTYLAEVRGPKSLSPTHAALFGQLLLLEGKRVELARYLDQLDLEPAARTALRCDLLLNTAEPTTDRPPTDGTAWFSELCALMGWPTAAGFMVGDLGTPRFDGLHATASPGVTGGPLVSVIVPTYRPTDGLRTAIRSLIEQSWADLEIIVVNDGSPAEHRGLLAEIASLDDRIRVLHADTNGGVYRARNHGLDVAAGDFVTFQDDDDWSHPYRIERQIQPLLDDESLLATRSHCVRLHDDMSATVLGKSPTMVNTSSLMYRRDPTFARLGYFDEVRRAADNEFLGRLEATFGPDTWVDLPEPKLAAVRLSADSLSRGDFLAGWRHPARREYRAGYERWHREIQTGTDPFLPRGARRSTRPFPAPLHFTDEPEARETVDVLFVGDWRAYGGPQRSMIEEIEALREHGLHLGVAHFEALRFMTTADQNLCEPIRDLVHRGVVRHVLPVDVTDVGLAILRYPPILQFPPADTPRWDVGALWVVANQAPGERDGSDLRYLVSECDHAARELFGCLPLWVPQGPSMREVLHPLAPEGRLAPFDNPGIVDPDEWHTEHRPWERDRPHVGRYSRDDRMKFPASGEELLAAYGDPSIVVRMMGATKQVARLLDGPSIPSTWDIQPAGREDVKAFLRSIDFFVYFDNPTSNEAFGRSPLEAIASGCLTILPIRYAPVFGPAAVYCAPQEVASVVEYYWSHPDRFREKVSVARSEVAARFSPQTFSRAVLRCLRPASVEPRDRDATGARS